MATATRQFTKRFIDTFVPKDEKETVIRDSGQTGLALRVRPSGTRTLLVVWYRGKQRRRTRTGRLDEFKSIKPVGRNRKTRVIPLDGTAKSSSGRFRVRRRTVRSQGRWHLQRPRPCRRGLVGLPERSSSLLY